MESSLAKIKVENPLVDLDGDEMTRVIWAFIKEKVKISFIYKKHFPLKNI